MKKGKSKNKQQVKQQAEKVQSSDKQDKAFRFSSLIGLAIIVVVGVLIYSNSFTCSFHFDDQQSIVDNTRIRDISNIQALWQSSKFRFMAYYSFAINYHFGGLNEWGYHFFNLGIHIMNAFLVYWLTFLIFSTPALENNSSSKDKKLIAFLTALLFVSHPLATQSVTYIVQRMASLVSLFYLLSCALYVKARLTNNSGLSQYLLFAGCFVAAVLALLSKENAFTLPLAIVSLEIFFLRSTSRTINFKDKRVILLIAAFLVAIIVMFPNNPGSFLQTLQPSSVNDYRTVTPFSYLLTQFSVIVKYIGLLLFPLNLNLDYDFPLSTSFFEARAISSFAVLLSLLVAGTVLYKKHRILSFGIFWFFLTLSIESSIIPIGDLIFEHRTYLPSFGFFIFLSYSLYLLLWNSYKSVAISIFLAIIVSNSYLTYQRNKVWQNDLTLWTDVISKSPKKWRGYYNRGYMFEKEGKNKEALADFNKAIELQPKHSDAYCHRGNVIRGENYAQALDDYTKAISLKPKYSDAYSNRGLLLLNNKQYEQALLDFDKTIEIDSAYVDAYYNRGKIYRILNQSDKSISDYSKAIEINPNYELAYNARGNAYMNVNKSAEALKDFNTAIEINPDYPTAYSNLGVFYMNQKKYEEAYNSFSKAISLKPDLAEAYYNRGFSAYNLGRLEMACEDMRQSANLGCQPANSALNIVCK